MSATTIDHERSRQASAEQIGQVSTGRLERQRPADSASRPVCPLADCPSLKDLALAHGPPGAPSVHQGWLFTNDGGRISRFPSSSGSNRLSMVMIPILPHTAIGHGSALTAHTPLR